MTTYGTTAVKVDATFVGTSTGTDLGWDSADVLTLEAKLGGVSKGSVQLNGPSPTTALVSFGNGGDGTKVYDLFYTFSSTNIHRGAGTMTGTVTFTATAQSDMGGGCVMVPGGPG